MPIYPAGVLYFFVSFAYLVVTGLAMFMPVAFRLASRKGALLWYGVPFLFFFLAACFEVG